MKKHQSLGQHHLSQWRKQLFLVLGAGTFLCTGLNASTYETFSNDEINVMQQQAHNVKGIVVDKAGEPIIGATILSKTSAKQDGTVTDIDGRFTLSIPVNSTIVVSFIGYTTAYIKVEGQKELRIVLEEDSKTLEEVIVVGYGTVKKADLAGSISVMDNKAFRDQPVTQVSQTLQGRVAGVQVDNSAAPGGQVKIRVRGSASINRSNDPLYVVDGIVRENGLTGINPDDIQSMQVLKDASSTAIYGSRGSNGVILITTKTGKANQKVISFEASVGVGNVYKQYDVLNAYEYATAYRETMDPKAFSADEMAGYKNHTKGIDWHKELFRTGITENYKLAISDGNERTQYYLSANYMNQKGLMYGANDKRYQLRANLTSDVTSWLHVTADINASHGITNSIDTGASGGNIVLLSNIYSPTMEMTDASGNYNKDPYNSIQNNPKGMVTLQNGESIGNYFNGMVDLRFQILPGLTFSTTSGIDYYDGKGYSFGTTRVNTISSAGNSNNYHMMLQNSNNLTYSGQWGKHFLTATGVWEASQAEYRSLNASTQNLAVESVGWWNLSLGSNPAVSNGYSKWTLLSGVGRVMYNFDNRYLLTGTVRADGSSKFSKDKWGYFPSVAVAWNLGNESFMKAQKVVENLKIRASYGIVGSQAIGSYSTLGLLSGANTYLGGVQLYPGYWSSALATPDVTWEKTKQFDLGFEVSLFNRILDVSFDYFNRKTDNALLQKTIPGFNGGGSYWVNAGEISNKGVDLSLTGHIISTKDFSWNSTLNLTYLKNKVVSLSGENFIQGTTPASGLVTEVNRIIPGESIGSFYGYVWTGINDKGDNTYEDLDGDKEITSADRKVLGKSTPDVTLGWNNQISWRNWDLNIFMSGAFGNKKLNLVRFEMASQVGPSKFITLKDAYYKGFDKMGVGAEYASLTSTTNVTRGESTQWLEKADYARLENITLAYNISKKVIKFADVKLYASAQNLFTITGYKGMDPASTSFSSANVDVNNGIDLGAYPTPRTFTLGVKLNF